MCCTKDKLTAQGFDLQFGANALGHLLFIQKLYHLLVSNTTPEYPARVIWASSSLHTRCTPPFNYEALRDTPARSQKFITPETLYESSKFAVVQLGLYMSQIMFKNDGIVMIVVDHGVQASNSSKCHKIKFVCDLPSQNSSLLRRGCAVTTQKIVSPIRVWNPRCLPLRGHTRLGRPLRITGEIPHPAVQGRRNFTSR